MHDIDRTLLESDDESVDGFEIDAFEGEFGFDTEGPFTEEQEIDLASQLLEVTDEEELDHFLGSLVKKAGAFIKSPAGQALKGILKSAAKKALPIVGGALGTAIGGPAGGMLGSKLASSAGRIFGLEIEGLSPEDQSFEVARQVVRFSGAAARNLANAPSQRSPQTGVKAAVDAAKKYAPGLLRGTAGSAALPYASTREQSGRWIRRGSRIILYGA